MPPLPLATHLDTAVRAIWPRRAHRELLLDLGERKDWTEDDHDAALHEAATWLAEELALPSALEVPQTPTLPVDLGLTRALGEALCEPSSGGVARWICGLAPALGAAPKTIANGLTRGLRADRPEHRWLAIIARVIAGGAAPDAWAFHRRSPVAVAAELGGRVAAPTLDAGDAILVLSLLALWQRRRPTGRARGNRGARAGRRATPKPIAALWPTLLQPGQIGPLGAIAREIGGAAGRHLLSLSLEAALTAAHLAPHPARRGHAGEKGEVLLMAAERALQVHHDLLDPEDNEVLGYRVQRMRAWRDDAKAPEVESSVRSAYVHASVLLEHAMIQAPPPYEFASSTPGLMMLLPQLRSRGFGVLK